MVYERQLAAAQRLIRNAGGKCRHIKLAGEAPRTDGTKPWRAPEATNEPTVDIVNQGVAVIVAVVPLSSLPQDSKLNQGAQVGDELAFLPHTAATPDGVRSGDTIYRIADSARYNVEVVDTINVNGAEPVLYMARVSR